MQQQPERRQEEYQDYRKRVRDRAWREIMKGEKRFEEWSA